MARKAKRTYQLIIESPEDQAFVKRLLEVYGYQEEEPGVFSESPKRTLKIPTDPESILSKTPAATQKHLSAKPATSEKLTAARVKKP